ncbi:hypothetical protein AAFC00_002352 [Neodothiora populina]|uniref:Uncharacterized protein n=1 Tax=Neodothiora populina TaxID=2781224 RepID=A0ABR3PH49_9PEZI
MPRIPDKAQTEGSSSFDPDMYLENWGDEALQPLYNNNFRAFIGTTFGLKPSDTYGYKATSEVTLLQAQTYLEYGGQGGLHGWYKDAEGQLLPPPPAVDIAAYTDMFRSTTSTPKALTALKSNAKKGAIRESVAEHLNSLYSPPPADLKVVIPKLKKEHVNPYLDVWAWTNQNLEWAGPVSGTKEIRISHALLPVLYHHFGCVVPTHEALCVIQQISNGRTILDLGSGNGYWTLMMRNFEGLSGKKKMTVIPVDNGLSEWRTMWIGDTVTSDGVKYLQQDQGAKDKVLLLVYPQVSDDFTGKILKAYKGDTIICAGTQNANGFTGFAKETIAEWMAREQPQYSKTCQIPLPSFAAKDEALFVFHKDRDTA